MEIAFAVSTAGIATIIHNAPASAENYTTGDGAYNTTDYVGTNADQTQYKNISGQARAQILQQIASASAGVLDFGKVVPTAQSGTIIIDSSGNISNTGGARYVPGSNAQVATLTFTGQPNQNILIDAPTNTTIANGANTMNVTFNYPTLPTNIGASGNVTMPYGGTLDVAANQAPGIYTGTYDIYVTYVA